MTSPLGSKKDNFEAAISRPKDVNASESEPVADIVIPFPCAMLADPGVATCGELVEFLDLTRSAHVFGAVFGGGEAVVDVCSEEGVLTSAPDWTGLITGATSTGGD